MPKIALVRGRQLYGYEEGLDILQSMSDWVEVSYEDLTLLKKYLLKIDNELFLIEKVEEDEVIRTVEKALELVKKEDKKREEAKRKREATKRRRAKEAEEKERAQYEKLREKFETQK